MAGELKRNEQDAEANAVLVRAMRDSNATKFLSLDLPLFSATVNDLFPGIDVPYIDYVLRAASRDRERPNEPEPARPR